MSLFAFANKILIYHICCVSIKDLSRVSSRRRGFSSRETLTLRHSNDGAIT